MSSWGWTGEVLQSYHMSVCRQALVLGGSGCGCGCGEEKAAIREESGAASAWGPGYYRPINHRAVIVDSCSGASRNGVLNHPVRPH
jgi:hypothetical protein